MDLESLSFLILFTLMHLQMLQMVWMNSMVQIRVIFMVAVEVITLHGAVVYSIMVIGKFFDFCFQIFVGGLTNLVSTDFDLMESPQCFIIIMESELDSPAIIPVSAIFSTRITLLSCLWSRAFQVQRFALRIFSEYFGLQCDEDAINYLKVIWFLWQKAPRTESIRHW